MYVFYTRVRRVVYGSVLLIATVLEHLYACVSSLTMSLHVECLIFHFATVSVGGEHTDKDEGADVKTKATAGKHFMYFCNDNADF